MPADELTHLDSAGAAAMVDVGAKPESQRMAVAAGTVLMKRATFDLIRAGDLQKGDVGAVARIAGIMAAKRTAELIPLCHPLPLDKIAVDLRFDSERHCIHIEARVRSTGKTGVEMEALTAVSVAGLTIYDMAKAVDREMRLTDLRLLEKRGGARGDYKVAT